MFLVCVCVESLVVPLKTLVGNSSTQKCQSVLLSMLPLLCFRLSLFSVQSGDRHISAHLSPGS